MSPLSPGTPLFKTAPGESLNAVPVHASPFSASPPAPEMAVLTVGDIMPQLPHDIARLGAVPPTQPLAVSPQVLDAALRSGQAAIPMFEIYRICPGLFQMPISPQDPRLVPLPAAKLPRLIASAQLAQSPQPAGAPPGMPAITHSPFGAAPRPPAAPNLPPQPSANPFGPSEGAPQAPQSMGLPPRRNGPPPPLGDAAARNVPSLALPTVPPQTVPGPSIGLGATPPAQPASPFGAPSSNEPPGIFSAPASAAKSSPFASLASPPSSGPSLQAHPMMSAPGPEGAGNPFGTASAVPSRSPSAVQTESPFTAPTAAPLGAPAGPLPASAFLPPSPQPTWQQPQAAAAPPVASVSHLRIGLANLVRGYSAAELGFDPMMIPSWIITTLPASLVRDQIGTGQVFADVGTLVDGITDQGFRKLVASAKREFQIKLPTNEVFHALSGTNAATLASLTKPAAANPTTSLLSAPPGEPASPGGGATRSDAIPLFSEPSPAPVPTPALPPEQRPEVMPSPLTALKSAPPTDGGSLFGPPAAPAAFSNPPPAPSHRPSLVPFQPKGFEPFPPTPSAAPASTLSPAGYHAVRAPVASPVQHSEGFSSEQLMAPYGAAAGPPSPLPHNNPFFAPPPTSETSFPPAGHSPTAASTTARFAAPITEPFPKSQAFGQPEHSPAVDRAQTTGPSSFVGVKPLDTRSDQLLLRALLATDEDLTPHRVVELTSSLPGIASCVCIQGHHAISHATSHSHQAREFQRQAADLAQHLRTLAPLIGIEGAETFTLTAGDRLMTFCFPGAAILGVLHEVEPSLGLRDKITLIGREVARMLA